MKKIKLLIENFWVAPRCFTGDALPRKDILFGKIQLFVAVLLSVQSSAGQLIGSISTPGRIISGEGDQGFHRPVMEKLKVCVLYFSLLSI